MAYEARCATGRLESGAALSRFPPHSFDTVVDTFGLCSHEDPVRVGGEHRRPCNLLGGVVDGLCWWQARCGAGAVNPA